MAKKQQIEETNGPDLWSLSTASSADDVTASYLQERKKNEDGLYRPKLEQAKDKKNYYATIRFLPNLSKEGKLGPTAVEKHIHYADFKNNPGIAGYYDCQKHFSDKCDMCTMFWSLKNSKNPLEQEKAKLIGRNTKYYSYVMILEDENNPSLEGKIMIFPFGFKIKQMIADQMNHPKNPCRIEDLANGRDFFLHIKMVGDYINYDSSKFEERGPLKVNGKALPLDNDGKIDAKYREKVKELLLDREKDLDEFMPQVLSEEQQKKVTTILGILSGQIDPGASNVTMDDKKAVAAKELFASDLDSPDAANFFAEEEETEDTEKVQKSKKDPFFDDL